VANEEVRGGQIVKINIILSFSTFVIGLSVGWFSSAHNTETQRKIESMLLLDKANSSVNSCDYNSALIYAAQSYVLFKNSPLSGLMLEELVTKKALFDERCKN
jgi:hypothetical protein